MKHQKLVKRLFLYLSGIIQLLLAYVNTYAGPIIKVACMGNSVTYGYSLNDPANESYPAKLQKMLGTDYEVKNFGHSGTTLLKKGHNPYYKTKEYDDAIAYIPDLVVIDLGLNDTDPRNWPNYRNDFKADYSWLINSFKKINPNIKIFICMLSPIFSEHPRFKSGTRDWYDQIQALIPQVALANGAGLIDINTPLHDRPELFSDSLHPNAEGAKILATTIYQAISHNFGGFKLNEIFGDHMVIQRSRPVAIYGTANTGDVVKVQFRDKAINAIADQQGHWQVTYPALQAGGPYDLHITCNKENIAIKDILIGDIWLCSGQSNMAFPLARSLGADKELHHAGRFDKIRLLNYKPIKETDAIVWDSTTLSAVNKLNYLSGSWQTCDSAVASNFSAVGYYFGKRISADVGVPIGIIQMAVGGSPVESWISRYAMEHDPQLVDRLSNWRQSDFADNFVKERADINLKLAQNNKQRHPYQPCYNYEAGISRIVSFPIKGVLWYQGESNANRPEFYPHAFKTLVNTWRAAWGTDLPFYFVQLSAIDRPSWPVFRLMQKDLSHHIKNCAMAVSLDVGDSLNVHYTAKAKIGERLALLALKNTYHKNIIADPPEPVSAKATGDHLEVNFPVRSLLKTGNGKVLSGFELVNEKGERQLVQGIISKNKVLITLPQRQVFKEVWYAMQPFRRVNLAGNTGLPVSTFTLDIN